MTTIGPEVFTVHSFSIISPITISTKRTTTTTTTTTNVAISSFLRRNNRYQPLQQLHAASSTTITEEDVSSSSSSKKKKTIVIVSPPGGGIGEVTAVKVAQQGYHVKWLVIYQNSNQNNNNNDNWNRNIKSIPEPESVVTLSPDILDQIQNVGGSLEFASANTIDVLSDSTSSSSSSSSSTLSSSSLSAITTWCNMADALICTIDGIEMNNNNNNNKMTTSPGEISSNNKKRPSQQENEDAILVQEQWKNAISIVTRAIATTTTSTITKIAILSASDPNDTDSSNNNNSNDNNNQNLLSPLTNLFNGGGSGSSNSNSNNMNIPTSLTDALMVSNTNNNNNSNNNNIITLRHGQILFGMAETSKEFTPFLNGPRKVPELCNEYKYRNIRIDPTYNVISGTNMFLTTTSSSSSSSTSSTSSNMDTTTTMASRTSRHAIGDAVVTLLDTMLIQDTERKMNDDDIFHGANLDICVTSQPGTDIVTPEEWKNEFQRVLTVLSSSSDPSNNGSTSSNNGIQLFQVEFGSVPNIDRLTDWMTTKWAPAILRTYDIAAIRTGPRPVYANRIQLSDNNNNNNSECGILEIIWQQLINFEPVTIGRMRIEITNTYMKAMRIIDDDVSTNGNNNRMALAGEDILVRRLAEAASQAIEKGLATKPKPVIVTTEQAKVVSVVPPMATVTTLQSPEPVVATTAATSAAVTTATEFASNESGPRVAGARRSTERIRKKSTQPTNDDQSTDSSEQ